MTTANERQDKIEERAERAMHRRDTLPLRADAVDRWFVLRELADLVPDLLAEVRRLREENFALLAESRRRAALEKREPVRAGSEPMPPEGLCGHCNHRSVGGDGSSICLKGWPGGRDWPDVAIARCSEFIEEVPF